MKKRSIMLAIATIAATVYTVYLLCYFLGGTAAASDETSLLAGAIATAMVTPHMILFSIGIIFGWIGLLAKKSWAALVAAILYSVGTALFVVYIMFGGPILILGFIGYANQRKINKNLVNPPVLSEN